MSAQTCVLLFLALGNAVLGQVSPASPRTEFVTTPKHSKPDPKLKIGDPAPPFTFARWLQGQGPEHIEAGRVYVVEFWATWCGPCVRLMPHLSELQAAHPRELTIVGVTRVDEAQSLENIEAWVKKSGKFAAFALALDREDNAMHRSYLRAAGLDSIPSAFVIDQKGTIAYAGASQFLGMVVPKVLDGTWDKQLGRQEIDAIEAEMARFNKALIEDEKQALEILETFRLAYPRLYEVRELDGMRLMLLIANGAAQDAKKLMTELFEKARAQSDAAMISDLLQTALNDLGQGPSRSHRDAIDLDVLQAEVDAEFSLHPKPGTAEYLHLAQVRHYRDDHVGALKAARKAVELAGVDDEKTRAQAFVRMFGPLAK
jgi:thiol-disulfide isomerase/thioredoxin